MTAEQRPLPEHASAGMSAEELEAGVQELIAAGPGFTTVGPSINLRSPLIVHIKGAGSNASRANITLS